MTIDILLIASEIEAKMIPFLGPTKDDDIFTFSFLFSRASGLPPKSNGPYFFLNPQWYF